jgi:hypoxanthine phosphoribosyltransferase
MAQKENQNRITLAGMPFEILLNRQEIEARVKALAKEVNDEFRNKNLHIVVVLKGAFVFAAEFIRHLNIEFNLDFITVSSYLIEERGSLSLKSSTIESAEGKNVLIVEDIVDSGVTADFLANYFQEQAVQTLKIASLLFKPNNFKGINKPDYVGFSIENEFVVGYGLDYDQEARGLSHIYQKTHE